jgi:hypothetical protein
MEEWWCGIIPLLIGRIADLVHRVLTNFLSFCSIPERYELAGTLGVRRLILSELRYVDLNLAVGLNGTEEIFTIPRRLGGDHALLPLLLRI